MSTDLAQKKTKAEDSTSLKLHKKGDDANMTILVIKIKKTLATLDTYQGPGGFL